MYNHLADLMEVMEINGVRTKQLMGDICNSSKYPLSIGAHKNVSDFDFV